MLSWLDLEGVREKESEVLGFMKHKDQVNQVQLCLDAVTRASWARQLGPPCPLGLMLRFIRPIPHCLDFIQDPSSEFPVIHQHLAVKCFLLLMEKSRKRQIAEKVVEEPQDDVASKGAKLISQTSCCYYNIYPASDLRQCLPGNFIESAVVMCGRWFALSGRLVLKGGLVSHRVSQLIRGDSRDRSPLTWRDRRSQNSESGQASTS
ncbi:hypothetical protein Q8A73_010724 [Channa argus]|nr:hypothetical protein Q8A73_010724 [Channa argus]